MNIAAARKFVKERGIVLESAHGPVPSLADQVAGEAIRGNWWSHPASRQIFAVTRAMRDWEDVAVCRLVQGRITYVHRRLWPAVLRLADQFPAKRVAALREVHTAKGQHALELQPFTERVTAETRRLARALAEDEARASLARFSAAIGLRRSGPPRS
jgi:hypothetical protein